ncbi:MAG: hypothetical protein LBQ15_13505 [Clostridium sp.]|jgi:hypothetical protein|nr:hypothetical protein [Clostridium sp.]
MRFWQKVFGKKKRVIKEEPAWDEIDYARAKVDFQDAGQRQRYIADCLEQITEASGELDKLAGEYHLVTSYLTDTEEVDALPEEERESIHLIAHKILTFQQEKTVYREKKDRMPDSEFQRTSQQESEMEEGIRRLKETESYHTLVKKDMQRLDGERHAYEYRRQELDSLQANYKGLSVIFLTALAVCLGLLAMLQFVFGMDAFIGYLIAVVAVAAVVVVLCLKYTEAQRERLRVENAVNRLIRLQNKVKIRYVNNVNLLDYLYRKYSTDSAAKLEKRWRQYLGEVEERKQYAEAEAKVVYYQKQLVEQLKDCRVKTPMRWIHQVNAILDKREMVELRHELILRRQSLRRQMDYHKEVAQNAKKEITDIAALYPRFSDEILQMVDRYEKKFQ